MIGLRLEGSSDSSGARVEGSLKSNKFRSRREPKVEERSESNKVQSREEPRVEVNLESNKA